jgi:hypothetical protein
MNNKQLSTFYKVAAVLVVILGLVPMAVYYWGFASNVFKHDQADEAFFATHMLQRGLIEIPALILAYLLFRAGIQMKGRTEPAD